MSGTHLISYFGRKSSTATTRLASFAVNVQPIFGQLIRQCFLRRRAADKMRTQSRETKVAHGLFLRFPQSISHAQVATSGN